MGYLHINNLYKDNKILLFKECYTMEKIHGTSAHILWKNNKVILFSGGAPHTVFTTLFNYEKLTKLFTENFPEKTVTIFGEAYGSKEQGMSETYGKQLKFIVFDVQVGDMFVDVPTAENIAKQFELEFVHYNKIDVTIENLDAERSRPSTQAKRNGITEDKISEGIVVRPLVELRSNNDERVIAKHKNDIFRETKTVRVITEEKLAILGGAEEVATEWVTEMRLTHVLDKLQCAIEVESIKKVIIAMVEDILREAVDEIVDTPEVRRAIGVHTAIMFKDRIKNR